MKSIELDNHETDALLRCLNRAEELGRDTDNYDVQVMAGELADMLTRSGRVAMAERRQPTFTEEAHRNGLLTFIEVADQLGVLSTDVLDLMSQGAIQSVRIGNRPCATPEAVRAYQLAQRQ